METFNSAETIRINLSEHYGRSQTKAFCALCREKVSLMSFQQATMLDEASQNELVEFLENGAIHRLHNSRGQILICFNSLQKAKRQSPEREFLSLELARSLEMV